MKRLWAATTILVVVNGHAWAQTATGVGVGTGTGVGIAKSQSTSVGGGAGNTGTLNNNPTSTVTIGGAPTTTNSTITTQGKTSVSTVPSVFAPGLAAAGLETCLGSVSVGASWLGTGLTGGGSIPDAGCAARLDARTLWSMGLKKAAVARLCLNPDIYRSMPDVCASYLPTTATPTGYVQTASAAQPYAGGDIWLVDGKTGQDRLCHDYDTTRQRCRAWDGAVMHVVSAHKKGRKQDAVPSTTAALKEENTK